MAKELKKVNVVTVGVGFTGGIALAECAKAGLSVVGLERGDRRGVEDFQDIHDEWRYAVNYGLMQDLSKETITFRNTEEMRALPMPASSALSCSATALAVRACTGTA